MTPHPYTDQRNRNLCDICDKYVGHKSHVTPQESAEPREAVVTALREAHGLLSQYLSDEDEAGGDDSLVEQAEVILRAIAPLPSDTPPEPHPVLAKYGLETMEGDQLAILERHLTGNAAATIGAWKTTAEGWERRARAAESDTPADELDEEREISLVGAEELGHAVAETPWPPVESDAIGETVTGHGAVLLARLHRRGWALVPLAATLDHREQPYGTQEYPKADTMHEELES